jgi:hypothetical protein
MPPEVLERGAAPEKNSPAVTPGLADEAMGVAIVGLKLHQIRRCHFQLGGQRSAVQARVFEVALEKHAKYFDSASAVDDHPNIATGAVVPQDLFNPS